MNNYYFQLLESSIVWLVYFLERINGSRKIKIFCLCFYPFIDDDQHKFISVYFKVTLKNTKFFEVVRAYLVVCGSVQY